MPTDNISTSVISQTESLLTPLTSKNSEPVGSSFEQTLANEVQNNDSSDAKPSSTSPEKPSRGLAETRLIAPTALAVPNRVACGPLITSTRSRS